MNKKTKKRKRKKKKRAVEVEEEKKERGERKKKKRKRRKRRRSGPMKKKRKKKQKGRADATHHPGRPGECFRASFPAEETFLAPPPEVSRTPQHHTSSERIKLQHPPRLSSEFFLRGASPASVIQRDLAFRLCSVIVRCGASVIAGVVVVCMRGTMHVWYACLLKDSRCILNGIKWYNRDLIQMSFSMFRMYVYI